MNIKMVQPQNIMLELSEPCKLQMFYKKPGTFTAVITCLGQTAQGWKDELIDVV